MNLIWRPLAVSLVFSAAGLTWVILRVGSVSDLLVVRELPVAAFAGALVAMALGFLFAGLRLQLLSRRLGSELRLHHAVRAHLLGMFGATVTPGGSGNLPAIAITLQHHGQSGGRAWAVGAAVFGADATFHAWSTPIALVILYAAHLYPRTAVALGLGVAALLIAAALAYLVQFRLGWLVPLTGWILRGPLLRWRARGLRFVDGMVEANRLYARAPLRFHVQIQLYSLLAALSFYAILFLLARGLSVHISFWTVAAALTVINIMASFVPTPGGSGFFELGISYLLIARGGGVAVPAIVLVWRVLTYYSTFLFGPMLGGYLLASRSLARRDAPRGPGPAGP